jgi:hypothetical protein
MRDKKMETIVFATSIVTESSYQHKPNAVLCKTQHMMKPDHATNPTRLVCELCGYFFEVKGYR